MSYSWMQKTQLRFTCPSLWPRDCNLLDCPHYAPLSTLWKAKLLPFGRSHTQIEFVKIYTQIIYSAGFWSAGSDEILIKPVDSVRSLDFSPFRQFKTDMLYRCLEIVVILFETEILTQPNWKLISDFSQPANFPWFMSMKEAKGKVQLWATYTFFMRRLFWLDLGNSS